MGRGVDLGYKLALGPKGRQAGRQGFQQEGRLSRGGVGRKGQAGHAAETGRHGFSLNYFIQEMGSVCLSAVAGRTDTRAELSPELPAQPRQQDQTPSGAGVGLQPPCPCQTRLGDRRHDPECASVPGGRNYLGVPPPLPFFGVVGFLVCQRCPWMVKASTLMDMVLAGIWVKRLRSELYL